MKTCYALPVLIFALAWTLNAYLSTATAQPQLVAQDPARFAEIAWTALAEDAKADARNTNLADGKALSYHYDAATDTLWFRLDLHTLPSTEALGLNLVVDMDMDQATGANWWGSNRAFTFDRLVTIWVQGNASGYRGTVGLGSTSGVSRRAFTDLATNNLALSIDTENPAFIVGVKRSELDDDGTMRLIAAVGSNRAWNDDIGDTKAAELMLSLR